MSQMIIDTDSHLSEAPDLWTSRLPKAYGDQIMQIRWNDDLQTQVWTAGDRVILPAWAGANFGWPQPFPSTPPRQEDVHPACYDASARLKAMDESGIGISVLYPNAAGGFAFDTNQSRTDRELTVAHIRAYNDYLNDWTSIAPKRFVRMAVVPYWWIDEAVAEVERCVPLGHRGIVMTGVPQLHGQPYLSDPHWDPLWAVCQEAGIPVNFHVANGDQGRFYTPERMAVDGSAVTYARSTTGCFLDNGQTINDLLICGLLARFPDLKFVAVESGIGWIPFLLEAVDYHFKRAGVLKEHPEFGDALPSDLFRRQVYANYWFERLEDFHLERIGAGNILFETDFPHPTCLYGREIEEAINNGLDAQPDEVRQKILWKNAAALYGLDVDARSAAEV